jgi:hypothetical protein
MKIICFGIFLLIVITSYLILNELLIKETYSTINRYHRCPSFTETMPPSYSYKSPSKGWCTTADYGPIPLDNDFDQAPSTGGKCPPTYSKVSGDESIKYESKAWCAVPKKN